MLKFELIRAEDVICDICFETAFEFAELEYEVQENSGHPLTELICFCKPCLENAVKLFDQEKDNLK